MTEKQKRGFFAMKFELWRYARMCMKCYSIAGILYTCSCFVAQHEYNL